MCRSRSLPEQALSTFCDAACILLMASRRKTWQIAFGGTVAGCGKILAAQQRGFHGKGFHKEIRKAHDDFLMFLQFRAVFLMCNAQA